MAASQKKSFIGLRRRLGKNNIDKVRKDRIPRSCKKSYGIIKTKKPGTGRKHRA